MCHVEEVLQCVGLGLGVKYNSGIIALKNVQQY